MTTNWGTGKGLGSSAALEVAVMQALNVAFKLELDGGQLAQYCHKVRQMLVLVACR